MSRGYWNERIDYVHWKIPKFNVLKTIEDYKRIIAYADDNIKTKHIESLIKEAEKYLTRTDLSELKLFIASEFPEKYSLANFKIGTHYSSPKFVELKTNGIYSYVLKYNEEKKNYYRTNEEPLWKWDNFQITEILIDKSVEPEQDLYNFQYNDKEYEGKSFDEMKNEMSKISCLKSSSKQLFGQVIHQYIKASNPIKIDFRQICGFTESGWTFPDRYYIKFNAGIQQEFKRDIITMLSIDTEKEKTKEKMKNLYNDILKVQHKDIILAYGTIAPFLFTLMEYSRLSPYLALYSSSHTTGKSTSMKLITKIFWNNFDLLTSKDLNRESHKRDYLSAGTFPIAIDESENIEDHGIDDLKGIATNTIKARFKQVNQELGMNKYYTSTPIYTFNIPPKIFNDTRYISRGLFIELTKDLTASEDNFKKFMRTVKNGEFGKRIIESTQDFTLDTLIELYEQMLTPKSLDSRQKVIWKIIHLGAHIFNLAFEIKLDLTNLIDVMYESKHFGSDNIFTVIKRQLQDGIPKTITEYDDNGVEITEDRFSPKERWINSEVRIKEYKGKSGYFYDANNLQDLKNRIRMDISGIKELREILRQKWKIGKYQTYTIEGSREIGIFIPKDALFNQNIVNDFNLDSFAHIGRTDIARKNLENLSEFIDKLKYIFLENEYNCLDPQGTIHTLELDYSKEYVKNALEELEKQEVIAFDNQKLYWSGVSK